LEARYSRMRRVLRVTTAASLSSLMRSVSTWALQRQRTQPLDQHIAQSGQQHAQLIALKVLATRARGK
jgi:membrane protein YqaA with SNARE-associated domain